MTSHQHPMPSPVWVAIDIAKYWNAALVELPDGRQQRFRFTHCLEDYDRLVGLLRSFSVPCRIAFEPTADYHRTLGFRLVREGFEVCLVSSVAGARLREAIFNSWDKNDPKDAEVVPVLDQGLSDSFSLEGCAVVGLDGELSAPIDVVEVSANGSQVLASAGQDFHHDLGRATNGPSNDR